MLRTRQDESHIKWLKDLKVGDKVIVDEQYISSTHTISEVVKITPKGYHRIKGHEGMLFKDGAFHRSGGYASYYLLEPTAERIDEINLVCMRTALKSIKWSRVDDDVVRKVWELVQ